MHELESGNCEPVIESGHLLAWGGIHNGHADRVGIRDTETGELFQPGPSRPVMLGRRKLDSDQRARFDPIDSGKGRAHIRAEQQEAMELRQHQVRGEDFHTLVDRTSKHPVGNLMILIPGAEKGNPGAAIDEDPIFSDA